MVFQRQPLECGNACLCMIFDYYGKPTTLDQLWVDCHVEEKGCNGAEMMRAARAYGVECRAFRWEAEQLRQLRGPAILHWQGNHFVVLEKIQGDEVRICDPAMGRIITNFEALRQNFTNIVFIFGADC